MMIESKISPPVFVLHVVGRVLPPAKIMPRGNTLESSHYFPAVIWYCHVEVTLLPRVITAQEVVLLRFVWGSRAVSVGEAAAVMVDSIYFCVL